MVYSESSETDLLLQTDESNDLDEFTKECNKRVRWDFSSEQARLAKWTSNKILENISEALEEHSAVSHADYIKREVE